VVALKNIAVNLEMEISYPVKLQWRWVMWISKYQLFFCFV